MFRFIIILSLVIAGLSGSICLASPSYSQDDVRYAQKALTNAGFAPGPVDGIMGKKTRSALRQYQKKTGLAVTGDLDTATLAVLRNKLSSTKKQAVQTDTAHPIPSVKENQSQPNQQKNSNDDPESETPSSLSKGNWVRLSLIVLLGFAALGPVGWFVATFLGVGLAFLIQSYVTSLWPLSIMIGLATVYTIPLLVAIFWNNFSAALILLLLFSLPVTLVSHYFFETQWLISLIDGGALVVLAPFGISQYLLFFGIIDKTRLSRSRSSHTETKRPSIYNTSRMPDHFVKCDAPSQSSSSPIQPR